MFKRSDVEMDSRLPEIRMDVLGDPSQPSREAQSDREDARNARGHGEIPRVAPFLLPTTEKRGSAEISIPSPTEPISPTPSADRLSVTFGPDVVSTGGSSGRSSINSSGRLSIANSSPLTPTDSLRVRFSKAYVVQRSREDDDEDDAYSASIDALLRRRESKRRGSTRRSPIRRVSSPFSLDSERYRRRSSTMTSISGDTHTSMEDADIPEDEIFENIRLHKEVMESVKTQAWRTQKKLKVIRQAKAYIKKHEGLLEQRLAQSKSTKDIMARYKLVFLRYWSRIKREAANIASLLVPWEQRIKRIESQFGSAVASYFIFLRWIFWMNIVMSILMACFIIIPEVLAVDRSAAGLRKDVPPDEQHSAFNLQTLWDFEGWLKYSPIFYGYYTNKDKTKEGYRLPFAYFMTSIGMYVYSFWAILKKMAENSRMSKMSDKDEECTFTWKLFTGWDYMIGNSETSQNKVASLVMGFKESILEEQERSKEGRNWKIIALRTFANFLVLVLLTSSAYAVVVVVERSQQPDAESDWWRQNEVTVVVSMITTLFPNLFEIIGLLESYHPRNALQWQLSRILILNMLNVYTLNFALFDKVSKMSEELESLRPNTTIPPATSTLPVFPPTTLNTTGWNSTLLPTFTEPQIIHRLINTSSGIFNLTGLDPNCTVIPSECDITTSTVLVPLINFTSLLPTLLPTNVTFFTDVTKLFNLSTHDSSSTVRSVPYNASESWDANNSWPIYNDTSLSNVSYSTNAIPNETVEVVLPNPSNLKSLSRVYLPPHLAAKASNDSYTNSSLNISDIMALNASDYGVNLTLVITDWITSSSVDVEQNDTTNVTTSTALPLDENLEVDSSLPPTFSVPFNISSEPQECFKIWCPNITEFPSDFYEYTDPDTTFPPTNIPMPTDHSGIPGCGENNCSETTEETVATTMFKINGYDVDKETTVKLRKLCWETMFGQEIVKLTIMDLVLTIIMSLIMDFIRAIFVRVMNKCWCWDLEKQFPGYGDFKIAENILHLVNNQGMIWMGTFFSPGLPSINMVKLLAIMYLRSWAVLTCNVPHEIVFKASSSNNFYYALLLTMLFLCSLPVAYAVFWIEPSWHCGPFSQYSRIYRILTTSITSVMPNVVNRALDYFTSPSIVIPLLVLLTLVIYYLLSLSQSLREANKDLKDQLQRERTEMRKKVFQASEGRDGAISPGSKWPNVMKKILPVLPNKIKTDDDIEKQAEDENESPRKQKTVPKLIGSDDESGLNETDQETSSVVFADETKPFDKSDVPLITISQAKNDDSKRKDRTRDLAKTHRGKDANFDDKAIEVDQRIPLLSSDDVINVDEEVQAETKKRKKKPERIEIKEDTGGNEDVDADEEGKKRKKRKEEKTEKRKDEEVKKKGTKKDKKKEEDEGEEEDKKTEKGEKKKDKEAKKKEKDDKKKEKEEKKKDKDEKKKDKDEKKKEKEEKKKDKEEKKKEKEEKKKEKEEKKKEKEEKKKDKDDKKKEKDEKEKKEDKKKEKEDKKKEKDKKKDGKEDKDGKKKGKDENEVVKEKKKKEDKSKKEKSDSKTDKEAKTASHEKKHEKRNETIEDEGKGDKRKSKESRENDKKGRRAKEERRSTLPVLESEGSEETKDLTFQQEEEEERKETKKSKSRRELIEMNNFKSESTEDTEGEEGKNETGITGKKDEEESPSKNKKSTHFKGDGWFESDTAPLVADIGTPSSVASSRVYPVDIPLDNVSISEEECNVSEVIVLMEDQQKLLSQDGIDEQESPEDKKAQDSL